MLTRTPAPQRQERNWFQFSAGLIHSLCSDYIAVRLLYWLEPLTTAMTILPKMLDVVEKALKLHLAVQNQSETALSDTRSEYGHNLEKLRAACAQYEKAFDHPDIRALTKDLNDKDGKLYQHMRYGSQETTTGWQTNLALLLPVVDRVFAFALLRMPAQHRRLLLFCSPLKFLITRSRFDQSRNPDQLTELLSRENEFFREFVAVFEALDSEHEQLSAQLHAAAEGHEPSANAEASCLEDDSSATVNNAKVDRAGRDDAGEA